MANLQYGQNSRHFIHSSHLALLLGTHTLTMGVIENICYCKTLFQFNSILVCKIRVD